MKADRVSFGLGLGEDGITLRLRKEKATIMNKRELGDIRDGALLVVAPSRNEQYVQAGRHSVQTSPLDH